MAFTEIASLDTDVTTQIGGVNKKTGKKNPTTVEGYYLGSKKIDSKKSKSGYAYLHILQTPKGNIGVWGKTDMDRKLTTIEAGTMVRITFDKMVPTPNGDMYKFKVEADSANKADVSGLSEAVETGNEEGDGAGVGDNGEDYVQQEDVEDAAALLSQQQRKSAVEELLKSKTKTK